MIKFTSIFLLIELLFPSVVLWTTTTTTTTTAFHSTTTFVVDNREQRQWKRKQYHSRLLLSSSTLLLDQDQESTVVSIEKETEQDHTDANQNNIDEIDRIMSKYNMPWKSSTTTTTVQQPYYMPFFEWQLQYMKNHLTNLQLAPTTDRRQTKDMTYIENTLKKQRMITLCFTSDEYRLIRMTLLDGGNKTQVFTSLWYPQPSVDLPLLGIDLLQFTNHKQQRYLTVVDFQPIPSTEKESSIADYHGLTPRQNTYYEQLLKPIRDQYPSLQHQMSNRFYDESDGFFSSQMLMGKETIDIKNQNEKEEFSNSSCFVWKDLFPAFQQYVRTHVKLVKQSMTSSSSDDSNNEELLRLRRRTVLQGHKRYDDYSSVRDPAHGLLTGSFGKEYADDFVYDVLFPLSDRNHSS